VLFTFFIVTDAYKQQAVNILSHLGGIFLAQYLADGGVGILVIC